METIVTAEQRAAEIESRRKYENSIQAERERLENELRQNLTVAERLMMRSDTPQFNTIFTDKLGDFPVRSRMMVRSERMLAAELFDRLSEVKDDFDAYDRIVEEFKELAKALTGSEMSTYWDSEKATDDVAIAVVTSTLNQSMRLVGEAMTSFRIQ